jgi:hypothetical protein
MREARRVDARCPMVGREIGRHVGRDGETPRMETR